mmetsp:Transcript_32862/g.48200  ORF Transcript_32862/g.48200 Transcript_32862/m.48200 type:complete len:165 (+) Transcript_32862:219-713(+)|eukprot:CAMPEP_0195530610 /NCGR_PEP_ID=MMETSP0794_2-20130614/33581_1 /TAXON_ID=515487 /ORGANISM="Stephanopyxis turris, Strain CCMP 815" /LENGTH=164 /DNA_ID=CAMNT_0040662159 /DNA_START=215 /DNA_END=709 /DNA_ORIENTATION=-
MCTVSKPDGSILKEEEPIPKNVKPKGLLACNKTGQEKEVTIPLTMSCSQESTNINREPLEQCQQSFSPTPLDLEPIRVSATTGRKRPRAVSEDEGENRSADENNKPSSKTLCTRKNDYPVVLVSPEKSDGGDKGEFHDDCLRADAEIHPELIEACDFLRSVGLG